VKGHIDKFIVFMLKSKVMKQRSTTPVSKRLVTKSIVVATAVMMVLAAPLAMMPTAKADKFDDQINALQRQADEYQAQANEMAEQANTLQNKLKSLGVKKSKLQAQIDLSQAKFNKLQQQIKETEQKISDNKDALGVTIADLYVDDTISPLEMLASSSNIGDYVDKQTYRSSMSDELKETINEINDLKDKLEQSKKDVKVVLDKQKAQRNSLVAVENQQAALLRETKGKEAAYQKQVAQTRAQVEEVASQQRAYFQRLLGGGSGVNQGVHGSFQYSNLTPSNGAGGCSGGYPSKWCVAQDTVTDEWDLFNRECVSYVAWALQYRFGRNVQSFQGSGNAGEWPYSANKYSGAYRVNKPSRGDAVILPATSDGFAPVGHVMIVEYASGDTMHVSQFNFYGTGQYSEMDIKNSGVILLRFPPA